MSEITKVALVTGAGRGIGRTIAIGLATLGYKIALIARSENELNSVAEEIGDSAEVLVIPVDVMDESSIKKGIASVIIQWGRIDVLVNNAGIFELGTLEVSSKDFDHLHYINLRAPFIFMKEVVPGMKVRKSGHIFNIASISGVEGYAGYGAYASSKFGLVGLSEALFKEVSVDNVKVTAICPSWVDTQMAHQAGSPLDGEQIIQPIDIMKTISWLLSLSTGASVSKIVLNCSSTVG